MVIELYIIIQILAFVIFLISWFRRNLILWVLSIMLFGIQAYTSFNIEYLVTIVESTGDYITNTIFISSIPMSTINVLFGLLCIIMFFWDIFNPDGENIQIPNTNM